jgi:group II intron reverse transcriptase/maturase
LGSLKNQLFAIQGGYVIQLDICSFFDELNHNQLQEILANRVRDGVIKRLIGKWLKAGVMEDSQITLSEKGTKQGCVISPILANIYLHHVLDEWFHCDVLPRMKGDAFMMRFADDAVLAFANREDAERVLEVLPKRFERFSLRLHPEKTKLVDFRRPSYDETQNVSKPGTVEFLGFVHYWGKSRRGYWVVKQKTEKKRLRNSIRKITDYCKRNRHEQVEVQHHDLSLKMRGHYSYFGITNNYEALSKYYRQCWRAWQKWLSRRNNHGMTWTRFEELLSRYPLPLPRVVHSIYRT